MRLLEISGYSPRFDTCGRCGTPIGTAAPSSGAFRSFFLSQGSLVCAGCIGDEGGAARMSDGAVRFYRSLLGWNPSLLQRMRVHESLITGVNDAVDFHISHVLGRSGTLRKGAFIQSLSLDRKA
jgi:recombinational DNA repair protein (RecF pathway)